MTTRKATGVSSVARRLSGAQECFAASSDANLPFSSVKASQSRLRGDMEHFSHESAVNRYMRSDARGLHRRTNVIFGFLAATVFGVIGAAYVFVLS